MEDNDSWAERVLMSRAMTKFMGASLLFIFVALHALIAILVVGGILHWCGVIE